MDSRLTFLTLTLLLCGCGGNGAPPAGGPASGAGTAAQPWIVLSDLRIQRQGPKSTLQVTYRFVEGTPDPATKYHWIAEEGHGVSNFVSFVNEPVQLNPAGGSLTMEAAIGVGPHPVATFLATGPRSTSGGDPEPEHVSGLLHEGQRESSLTRIAPGQMEPPATFGQTVVLSNPRREQTAEGAIAAVDYRADSLPEAGRFFFVFGGAEGGSVSAEVTQELTASPRSGTLRQTLPDSPDVIAPFEIHLVAEPFGGGNGPPTDTSVISNTLTLP